MSKPVKQARAFAMPAGDLEDVVSPVAVGKSADAVSEAAAATPAVTGRPMYREGKKNLSVWLDEKAFRQFKSLVAEEGDTLQDYVIKMLNREFASKGRPQIAK
ncbi:hypothetical protein [Methylobacterium sp. Leaf94]|uniref:hypothetical protein n=1 Tax=Methylobacterium sp. Leaf94 TaxID=1736250 RepID=UPI0012E3F4A8|nr:hypothetical protein [Methylobacterium sp. Leaf94]